MLDGYDRSEHSITLKSLLKLCPVSLRFGDLAAAVKVYEVELLPVASEEFMVGVEDLPVQERECLDGKRQERDKPHDRRIKPRRSWGTRLLDRDELGFVGFEVELEGDGAFAGSGGEG